MNTKILDKIKKLLRLSKSSEPHEAALALQRAMELMQAHNISEQDIAISEVKEAGSQPTGGVRANVITHRLASLIAHLFSCDLYYTGYFGGSIYNHRPKTIAKFVGLDPNAEIAAYCFDVMELKLRKARNAYLKTIPKQTKKYNKTKRAHAFCLGWLIPIAGKVQHLVPVLELAPAVVAYMASKDLENKPAKNVNTGNKVTAQQAMIKGYVAGSKEEINAGVSGGLQKQISA